MSKCFHEQHSFYFEIKDSVVALERGDRRLDYTSQRKFASLQSIDDIYIILKSLWEIAPLSEALATLWAGP